MLQAEHLHGHKFLNSSQASFPHPPAPQTANKEEEARIEDGDRLQPLPASGARPRFLRAFEPAANEEGGVEGRFGEVVTHAGGGGGGGGGDEAGAGARDEGSFEGTA